MNRSWKLLFALAAATLIVSFLFAACGDDDDDDDAVQAGDDDATDDDIGDDDAADDDEPDPWQPVEPHREEYMGFTIAWYAGTPYEMGFQQGTLLKPELAAGREWLDGYVFGMTDTVLDLARSLGLVDFARENSYPDIVEECRGLTDAAADAGWSMDLCLLLNFGDVLIESLSGLFLSAEAIEPPGCTQIAARGEATTDGRLIHGRSLDWSEIDYLIDYPVIHVRQPSDGIPHAYIGFPGNLSPYSGINAMGVSGASNEADPLDRTQQDRTGRSHVQMLGQLLKRAHNLDEARAMVAAEDHMSVEIVMAADGVSLDACAFEMTAQAVGTCEMEDDVVVATNHFVAPGTEDLDGEPAGLSSTRRYRRAMELVAPGGADTHYGAIDAGVMVEILRDRVNPDTGEEAPEDTFDNNAGIATNGAMYQIVFDPQDLLFWVAAGEIPVPRQPFVGFSLGELLGYSGAAVPTPAVFE